MLRAQPRRTPFLTWLSSAQRKIQRGSSAVSAAKSSPSALTRKNMQKTPRHRPHEPQSASKRNPQKACLHNAFRTHEKGPSIIKNPRRQSDSGPYPPPQTVQEPRDNVPVDHTSLQNVLNTQGPGGETPSPSRSSATVVQQT